MSWIDIACIVFACATANHMGLIESLEKAIGRSIPVLNCVKCSTFWFVLAYSSVSSGCLTESLAVSFLASYLALWVELSETYIDTLYIKLYGTITETDNGGAPSSDPEGHAAEDPMPDMRQEDGKENEVTV